MRISEIINSIETSWIEEFFDSLSDKREIINLGIGEPDFGVPEEVKKIACSAIAEGKNRYTPTAGLRELRELIAEKYGSWWNVDLDYSNVILTPGASNALFMIIASLVKTGDEVIIPSPSYPSYEAIVRIVGGKPVEIPTVLEEDFKPKIEEINECITQRTRLIIVNTPTNPTGYVYDEELLNSLVDLASEKDIYILSDEVYEKFVYDGEFTSCNKFRTKFDKIITVHSFSKTYGMTGWRLGFAIGDKSLIKYVIKLQTYMNACPPSTAQYAVLHALSSPYVAEVVKLNINSYRTRRDLIYDLLKRRGFSVSLPRGAFYIFPRIPLRVNSYEFCKKLLMSQGVVVMPGKAFGGGGEGHFRITFAVSPKLLIQAIELIEKFVSYYNQ
ncbi:MAG: pyridoxal phosphate-dependent aminotransferase [Nitrososphaerota archaeon]